MAADDIPRYCRFVRGGLAALALLVIAPETAHAGRTFYGWLYGTEVMPERGAEIQTWITDEADLKAEGHYDETDWVVQPAVGITDQLELVMPVQMIWIAYPHFMPPPRTTLESYGAELRYRLVTPDAVDAPPIVPLVRFALKRLVTERDTLQPEADVVVSYQQGRFHGLVDVGTVGQVSQNTSHFELHPGAGVSIETIPQLRFGAEVYSEVVLDNKGGSTWVVTGPNIAWSHGRSWFSASFGVGVYNIKDAGRLQWGIAF
jgi:hypothetical protein